MKKLYLECNTGISGDMFVAAMLDLGADAEGLKKGLESLEEKNFQIKISRVNKAGLDMCDFDVLLENEYDNHDADMDYLYSHLKTNEASEGHCVDVHSHEHEHHHENEHYHEHEHHHEHEHTHVHRRLSDVVTIIDKSSFNENTKIIAKKIFAILGKAEAKAHGKTLETIHFHEVGAIDSIVDILSAAYCVDNLGIEKVYVPSVTEGSGTVRCAHGILPIPVPAVANIVADNDVNIKLTNRQGELITPTGAAIVAAIKTDDLLPEEFKIKAIGLGAGKREYEIPSMLRAIAIENEDNKRDTIWKLETDIDDCSGEALGFVMEKLFEGGAREVHYTPIFMKKNRPAYELTVICDKSNISVMEDIIFTETTTIGVRKCEMNRRVLRREIKSVKTEFGEALVKVCYVNDSVKVYPEYESVKNISKNSGRPLSEMYKMVQDEYFRSGE